MATKLGFSTGKGFIRAYKDANGVLKCDDAIITQKKLVWEGTRILSAAEEEISMNTDLRGKKLEIEISMPFGLIKGFGKMNSVGYNNKTDICQFIDANPNQISASSITFCAVYARATETSLIFSKTIVNIAGSDSLSGSVSIKKVYEVIE